MNRSLEAERLTGSAGMLGPRRSGYKFRRDYREPGRTRPRICTRSAYGMLIALDYLLDLARGVLGRTRP